MSDNEGFEDYGEEEFFSDLSEGEEQMGLDMEPEDEELNPELGMGLDLDLDSDEDNPISITVQDTYRGRAGGMTTTEISQRFQQDVGDLPTGNTVNIELSVLSEEEKRKMAAVYLTGSSDGENQRGTLSDPAMGSTKQEKHCTTCKQTFRGCPGHMGLIRLPEPMYNPIMMRQVIAVLSSVCPNCSNAYVTRQEVEARGVDRLPFRKRLDKIAAMSKSHKFCTRTIVEDGEEHFCGDTESRRIYGTYKKQRNFVEYKLANKNSKVWRLYAKAALVILRNISRETADLLGFSENMHPKNYIMESILVPPNCVRPRVDDSMGAAGVDRSDSHFGTIINFITKFERLEKKTQEDYTEFMGNIFHYYQGMLEGGTQSAKGGRAVLPLSKQIGAKGIMFSVFGKRGNHCGRSVITGNDDLGPGYLGVPRFIANTLTYPEIVSDINRKWLQRMFVQGKVLSITKREGKSSGKSLNVSDEMRRNYILQTGDIVRRVMINGDIVMFGRQPTLHEGSLMGFRVIITEALTFQLSLVHVKSFNADFDGDEMNLYFPQSEEERAEVLNLNMTHVQGVARHTGVPLQGPTFNTLLSTAFLTTPGVKVSAAVFGDTLSTLQNTEGIRTLYQRAKSVGMDVDKMVQDREYPGSLLFSAALPPNFWYQRKDPEGDVLIVQGILISGKVTALDIGAKANSIVQILFNEYDSEELNRFNGDVTLIAMRYLQDVGFSFSVTDLEPMKPQEMVLKEEVEKAKEWAIPSSYDLWLQRMAELYKEHKKRLPKVRALPDEVIERSLEVQWTLESELQAWDTPPPDLKGRKLQAWQKKRDKAVQKLQEQREAWIEERDEAKEKVRQYEEEREEALRKIRKQADAWGVPDPLTLWKEVVHQRYREEGLPLPNYRSLDAEIDAVWKETQRRFLKLHVPLDDPFEEQKRKKAIQELFREMNNDLGRLTRYVNPNSAFPLMKEAKGSVMNQQRSMIGMGPVYFQGGIIEEQNPFLPKNSSNPLSYGFCPSSFAKGISLPEAFPHAISGREGLGDTATQTSEAGDAMNSFMQHLGRFKISPFGDIRDIGTGKVLDFEYSWTPEMLVSVRTKGRKKLSPVNAERATHTVNMRAGFDDVRNLPLTLEDNSELTLDVGQAPDIVLDAAGRSLTPADLKKADRSRQEILTDQLINLVVFYEGKSYGAITIEYYAPLRNLYKELSEHLGLDPNEITVVYEESLDTVKIRDGRENPARNKLLMNLRILRGDEDIAEGKSLEEGVHWKRIVLDRNKVFNDYKPLETLAETTIRNYKQGSYVAHKETRSLPGRGNLYVARPVMS